MQQLHPARLKEPFLFPQTTSDQFDEALANALRGIVQSTVGDSCRVGIERVSLIPRENSGKYRYYRREARHSDVAQR